MHDVTVGETFHHEISVEQTKSTALKIYKSVAVFLQGSLDYNGVLWYIVVTENSEMVQTVYQAVGIYRLLRYLLL